MLKLFFLDKSLASNLEDIGDVKAIEVEPVNRITQGECVITACFEFFSRLPGPIHCESISISLEKEENFKADETSRR